MHHDIDCLIHHQGFYLQSSTVVKIKPDIFTSSNDRTTISLTQIQTGGSTSTTTFYAFYYDNISGSPTVNSVDISFNTVNNTTFDTTIPNTLDVTAQWGAASNSNSIYSDIFVLNKIY